MRRSESRVDLARKHRLYMRNDEGKLRVRIPYIGYRARVRPLSKFQKQGEDWNGNSLNGHPTALKLFDSVLSQENHQHDLSNIALMHKVTAFPLRQCRLSKRHCLQKKFPSNCITLCPP